MQHTRTWKTPTAVLCLCLLTNVGRAAESATSPATFGRESDRAVSAPDRSASTIAQPLTPQELQELSKRAEKPGPDVVGGSLSNEHLTYIVIALAAAVLVLILK